MKNAHIFSLLTALMLVLALALTACGGGRFVRRSRVRCFGDGYHDARGLRECTGRP